MEERLQKILARAGIASRRKSEELIIAGRVSVNGLTVTRLGTKADAERADIRVDGRPIRSEKKAYYILNKPRGVLCTNRPDMSFHGRISPRAVDLIPNARQRLFTVGRLDADSEGLLILTNDGEFANRVAHPRYGVVKMYVVEVEGLVNQAALERLQSGVIIEGKSARLETARILQSAVVRRPADYGGQAPSRPPIKGSAALRSRHREGGRCCVEVTLKEGRKRQIRYMFEALGFTVISLKRTRIGSLRLEGLATGKHREMTAEEVKALLTCARPSGVAPARRTAGYGGPARRSPPDGGHPPGQRGRAADTRRQSHAPRTAQRHGRERGTHDTTGERPKGTHYPRDAKRGEGRRYRAGGASRPNRGGPRRNTR